MSDRNNSDNQNTDTLFIPPEVRNAQSLKPLRRVQQNPPRNPQGNSQHYPHNPQYPQNPQQYYGNEQYGNQQYGSQQYGSQQYGNQQYGNQQYGSQQYGNQQYYNEPYQNEPYTPPYPVNPPPQIIEQPRFAEIQRPSQPPHKKKKKRKKKNPVFKFVGRFVKTLAVLALVIFGMYSCTSLCLIKKMDYTATGDRNRRDDALYRSYVRNILLIGTDGRSAEDSARSDTMIIISMNSKTNEISLISLMRDCYVEIPNYGYNKLNASYAFGGAELLMDTIEHNFGISIEDYVSVNFISFANVVDSVGGIDLEVSDAEAQEINTILQAEVNEIMGDNKLDDLLKSGGKLHLNGKQALSYARIRYIGNADFERTERQRKVIGLVMDKVKSFNPATLPRLATSVLPDVKTNMSTAELYWVSLQAPFILGYDRQQLQIPTDGTFYGADFECGNSLVVDFQANYNKIYETAYSEE